MIRRKKYRVLLASVIIMLVISLSLLPACGEENPLPTPFFPVQKEVQTIGMTALLSGELVLNEGYPRVYDILILWPYGYTVEIEAENIWVLNEEGIRVVKVGDTVRMGGGEVSDKFAEEKIGHTLPEGCAGPYWLVSFEVEKEQ